MDTDNNLIEGDLRDEIWREYDIPGRSCPYRISEPVRLYFRKGGTTHRVLNSNGVVHCIPAVGVAGCVLRWKVKDGKNPVAF